MGWEKVASAVSNLKIKDTWRNIYDENLLAVLFMVTVKQMMKSSRKPTPTIPELKKSQKIIIHEKLKNIFISKVFFPVNIEDFTMNRYCLENQITT